MRPYKIARFSLLPIIRLWIRKITGKGNVPKAPFLIASNHASFIDDFTLVSTFIIISNRKVHMYCNDRFYRNWLFARFLDWAGCIPISIQTKNKETNKRAYGLALKYLGLGDLVGIFPEGGRSDDGRIRKARTGIAKLALASGLPVVPVGIIGSYEILPKGAKFPKLKRCEINIGKPLEFRQYAGKQEDKTSLEKVTREIMKNVASLSGQEYRF